MGLDVKIGTIINHPGYNGETDIRVLTELIDGINDDDDPFGFNSPNYEDLPHVEPCPFADFDVVSKELEPWNARTPYFRGWEFFQSLDIYYRMRYYPRSNDRDIAFIMPVLPEILALSDHNESVYYYDFQMVRFKYWCAKAVSLYGSKAAIEFS